jgi:hypothetical protein
MTSQAEAGRERARLAGRERQAPGQGGRHGRRAAAERAEVLGEARAQVLLDLREEAEVAQARLLPEDEPDPLRERRPRAELGAARVADAFGLRGRAEPGEGRVERGGVEADARGGGGAHAARGAGSP